MAHLLQYHNEAREGRWDPPYGRQACEIATNNPHKLKEADVAGHTCWLVVGRRLRSGHLFFLGSRFTVERFFEDDRLLPDYTHRAVGPGETLLIPLAGEWFERLYRRRKLYSFGFHFVQNQELPSHFERVVEEEHVRQAGRQPKDTGYGEDRSGAGAE
jgi:hypothetical protein